ncbi:MAG: CinA family protein [Herbiconiux sp.]|nr:CinA family protein [Herbiconiux sp.]
MSPRDPGSAERIVAALTARHSTVAVAESLTGGLLTAALVAVPGASVVLRGGVVAYDTALKHTLLGVDAAVLAAHGPVHPDVAMQMAVGVRTALAVDGVEPEFGIATTGVAGPGAQDGHEPGTAFVGVAVGAEVRSFALQLDGDRDAVRGAVVRRALELLEDSL